MEKLEKRLRDIELFHIYGELLSSSQKDILVDYLDLDLSITEIAENRGISRSAVDDAIKKGLVKLEYFESVVCLIDKKEKILKNVAVLREKIQNCKELEEIEEVLK